MGLRLSIMFHNSDLIEPIQIVDRNVGIGGISRENRFELIKHFIKLCNKPKKLIYTDEYLDNYESVADNKTLVLTGTYYEKIYSSILDHIKDPKKTKEWLIIIDTKNIGEIPSDIPTFCRQNVITLIIGTNIIRFDDTKSKINFDYIFYPTLITNIDTCMIDSGFEGYNTRKSYRATKIDYRFLLVHNIDEKKKKEEDKKKDNTIKIKICCVIN